MNPGGRDGLRRMRNLSPSDMRRIAEHAQKCISVVVNREGLLKAIDDAAADREAADNLQFLLNNGATRDLIADVLGVSDDRILNARSRLGTCSNARGRPKMPSANEREEIVARWHELSHLPDIERFRILRAQFPRWNIASLSACIKEFLLERPQLTRMRFPSGSVFVAHLEGVLSDLEPSVVLLERPRNPRLNHRRARAGLLKQGHQCEARLERRLIVGSHPQGSQRCRWIEREPEDGHPHADKNEESRHQGPGEAHRANLVPPRAAAENE